jgi:glycosyltransferase involved in cell wall biosynthesis
LQHFYGGAEAFCFPSLFEGFGIPLVEAMASGCPVLSSSASCMPEIVADAGLLIEPKDVQAWTQALSKMVADPKSLQTHRERGLVRARDFSWEQSAETVWKSLQPC